MIEDPQSNSALSPKGESPVPEKPRTVAGAQLSSSGEHLSTTGSGVRELFEHDPSGANDPIIPITVETSRPDFAKDKKRG